MVCSRPLWRNRLALLSASMNKSILIVEPDSGGHRANHIGIIVRHLRSIGIEPELLTRRDTIAGGGFDHLGLETNSFDREDYALPIYARMLPAVFRKQVSAFQQISSCLKQQRYAKTDYAIFPTLQASGLLPAGLSKSGFPVPWVGVVMAPGAHLRHHGIDTHHSATELWIQRKAYRGLAKQSNCMGISSFDPLFADWMNDPKVVYCPDPVRIADSSDTQNLVSSTDRPVILVAGSIDRRKKICELVDVLARVNRTQPLHLVIAGKPSDEMRPKLENSSALNELKESKSVDLILRRLSDSEMDALFQRADIVWSGNLRAYGSSGAVVRAGMHRKPVVTMQNSVLGNWMKSVDGGPVADLSSPDALASIFEKLVSDRVLRENLGSQNYSLFSDNTDSKYCEVLLRPLNLSTPASPQKV